METTHESLRQLFQQEFSKMVAVISNLYGLAHIALAEDIVSETFLLAAETWGIRGLPPNPPAWLYAVAKQKTLYHFRRARIFEQKVLPAMAAQETGELPAEPDFSGENIRDSQLQMLFAVCNPVIASEAQIGLALRILCGFGIQEIADAFLSSKETINKRLFRAREKLRTEHVAMTLPPPHLLPARLDNVLHVIYLLFSEGYYSRSGNELLRSGLCLEALRLGAQLTEHAATALPKTYALLALMCFHASRFPARQAGDAAVLYEEQDESLWDAALIRQGELFLGASAAGDELTAYHIEARIAWWHCRKADTAEKWTDILQLYDRLLQLSYSPAAALNRVFALYKVHGVDAAMDAVSALSADNHFYLLLLAELHRERDPARSRAYLEAACAQAGTSAEREAIRRRIDRLDTTGQLSGYPL